MYNITTVSRTNAEDSFAGAARFNVFSVQHDGPFVAELGSPENLLLD